MVVSKGGVDGQQRGPVHPEALTFPTRRRTPVSTATTAAAAEGADQSDSSESCSDEENGHARGAQESERAASSGQSVRGTQESERPTSSRRIGSGEARNTATAWVGVMHGVIVAALEFVLTLTNAVDQNAFGSRSGVRDIIFGGSTVMEAVGFLFALVVTCQNLRRLDAPVTAGMPAFVVVEAMFSKDGGGDLAVSAAVGVILQTLSFLTYVVAVKVTNIVGRVILICVVVFVAPCCTACALSSDTFRKCSSSTCWTVERMILVCIVVCWFTAPVIVEIWESVLLFESGSASLSVYTLAVLDLVIIAPATCCVLAVGFATGVEMTTQDTEGTDGHV